jgi:hypothetical protein
MNLVSLPIFNSHLARITALIGIPLVVLATALLAAIDLNLLRDRRVSRSLLTSSIGLLLAALVFMAYRFARLKL